MPIVDEKAPREADFDALLDLLRALDSDCATVFNCQGKKRDYKFDLFPCILK